MQTGLETLKIKTLETRARVDIV